MHGRALGLLRLPVEHCRRAGGTVAITRDQIERYTSTQLALVDALAGELGANRGALLAAAVDASEGEVWAEGARWRWRRHGAGVCFRSHAGRQVVDAHVRLGDPTLVDAWRLLQFCGVVDERRVDEREVFADLVRLTELDVLKVVDYRMVTAGPSLFRLAELHPEPVWELVVVGATGGGWIELQRGRFDNTHWKADSVFVDGFGSEAIAGPFERVLGGFDGFEIYEDLDSATVLRLAEAFHDEARRARSGLWDPREGLRFGRAIFGDMTVEMVQRLVADAADGIADWLAVSSGTHDAVSIIGV